MALGAPDHVIMFRELIPNALAPIVVAATLNVARAILLESYISFLGYGIQPPVPSWGNMLNNAQDYLVTAPWLAILPGAAITLAVTGFQLPGRRASRCARSAARHTMTTAPVIVRVGSARALQHRQRCRAGGQ
jgi:ABC-type dipeptide/oligopeptide/nickel transport system permease subunit